MTADHRRNLGKTGETSAALLAQEAGLVILERNWRDSRRGEVDLIARDDDEIVIIEVRTRIGTGRGSALESIRRDKLLRLRRLAISWAKATHCHMPVRVDVIAWTIPPSKRSEALDLIEGSDLRSIGATPLWVRGIA